MGPYEVISSVLTLLLLIVAIMSLVLQAYQAGKTK